MPLQETSTQKLPSFARCTDVTWFGQVVQKGCGRVYLQLPNTPKKDCLCGGSLTPDTPKETTR